MICRVRELRIALAAVAVVALRFVLGTPKVTSIQDNLSLLPAQKSNRPQNDPFDLYFRNGSSVFTLPTTKQDGERWTFLLQIGGEMGNNLGYIAYAHAVALLLRQEHQMNIRIALRHQDAKKWNRSWVHVNKCFPATRNWDIHEGHTQFNHLTIGQMEDLGDDHDLDLLNAVELSVVRNGTQGIVDMIRNFPNATPESVSEPVSHPFIYVRTPILFFHPLLEQYYSYFRRLFQFDYRECCNQLPRTDEIAFHFRNFKHELGKGHVYLGFEEIPPDLLSDKILKKYPKGSRVSILSRFSQSKFVQEYLSVLEQRGFEARVVVNNTAVQDFCYLMKADAIVGAGRSSFLTWAGILGKQRRAYVYSINSTYTRHNCEKSPEIPLFFAHQFQNSQLKSKFKFSLHDLS